MTGRRTRRLRSLPPPSAPLADDDDAEDQEQDEEDDCEQHPGDDADLLRQRVVNGQHNLLHTKL